MVKQVIVVRKDLNMRKGKLAAQVAHASMKVLFDRTIGYNFKKEERNYITLRLTPEAVEWIQDGTTKVIVSCSSLEELHEIQLRAQAVNLPHALITDAGKTEFHGVPTATCLAIGPADADKINTITGHLTLL